MISVACRIATLLVTLVLLAFASTETVAAAPQVLGLVATAAPVPLRCEGDTCVAYLSSFCLEPDRAQPAPGTQYLAAVPGRIIISGVSQPIAASAITFRAAHYFTSVRIELPRAVLNGRDESTVTVSALAGAALVPLAISGDARPHSVADIARATGTARRLAAAYFDRADPKMEAAQLVSQTISQLPLQGRLDANGRRAAWQSAARTKSAYSPTGFAKGKLVVSICQTSVDLGIFYNLRGCLNKTNHQLLGHRNSQFWKALKTGS